MYRAQADLIAKCTGCKGTYSLMKLPYHDRIAQTVPDAMHTITDSIEKIFYLIIGNNYMCTFSRAIYDIHTQYRR